MRQIHRRMDNGRQIAFITTHPSLPMQQVAAALFSRWSQENFFKQMRQEFNLDALSVQRLIPVDDNARVVNPDRRELEKQIRSLNSKRNRALVQMIEFQNQNRKAAQYEHSAQQFSSLNLSLSDSRRSVYRFPPMCVPAICRNISAWMRCRAHRTISLTSYA